MKLLREQLQRERQRAMDRAIVQWRRARARLHRGGPGKGIEAYLHANDRLLAVFSADAGAMPPAMVWVAFASFRDHLFDCEKAALGKTRARA